MSKGEVLSLNHVENGGIKSRVSYMVQFCFKMVVPS